MSFIEVFLEVLWVCSSKEFGRGIGDDGVGDEGW